MGPSNAKADPATPARPEPKAKVKLSTRLVATPRLAAIGRFCITARVRRRTRTLVFVEGELKASGRLLMAASGVFKILDPGG